jgi:phenylpropionate dioxygenase-like ring-hydroxylating dioxygenase large terminal subunit
MAEKMRLADHVTEDFAALLERDRGLPGRYFTDAQIFHLEREAVFESSWMCIGLSADAPSKGDLFPVSVFGRPLLMVRDGAALRVVPDAWGAPHRVPVPQLDL